MNPPLPAIYTDENVDGALGRALRRLGWDVVRAIDIHPPGTRDAVHFQSSVDQGRVFVTHDTDLLALAADWQASGRTFPGVIFYHPDKFRSVGETLTAAAPASLLEGARALLGAAKGVQAAPARR